MENCFLWKSPQARRLNEHNLAFLMHRVPLVEPLQPLAGRGSITACLSVGTYNAEDGR